MALMQETIYRTNHPERLVKSDRPEDFTDAEYRQLFIRPATPSEDGVYVVVVYQGWWSEAAKEPIHPRTLFSDYFATFEEADAAYEKHLSHVVSEGFVHSFMHVPFPPDFVSYRQLALSDGAVGEIASHRSPLVELPQL
jgi:hypothetical protein